jgi:hypothetical protein
MPGQPTFPIYDRMLGGRLALLLRRWRDDDDLSLYAIADRLAADHDIHVSWKTVGRWLDDLEDPGAA